MEKIVVAHFFLLEKSRSCRLWNVNRSREKGKLVFLKLCFGQLLVSLSSQFGNIIETLGLWRNTTGAVSRADN